MSIRKKTDEIIITKKQLAIQNEEKEQRAAELIVANEEVAFQNSEKEKCEEELSIVNNELVIQIDEKEKRAAELIIANKELIFQNEQKEKRAAELIIANWELAFQNGQKEKRAAELIIANKELAFQNEEKEKRAAELVIANKELVFQNEQKEKRAAELIDANEELAFQNKEKEKRAAELNVANKELAFQNKEKVNRAAELIIANEELVFENEEKEKRAAELVVANDELAIQNDEKEKRAAELSIANNELVFQNEEKEKRAAELIIANRELIFQNDQKEKRAAELIVANKELAFQNEEKENRAAELIIANKELVFQNEEKEKRAAELIVANDELAFQNEEKEKRAAEFLIANKELIFQNEEKENRAAELIVANEELAFQNEEKEKRAAELFIANKEFVFQNKEKEKRAAELIVANEELAFQNKEKEKRAAELIIANKELVFQNEEKEKRAAELIVANEELAFQNEEKEKRADELIIANEELAFQNEEKEKRAAELIIANEELAFQNEEKEKRAAELIIANKELVYQNEEKEKRAAELIIANKEVASSIASGAAEKIKTDTALVESEKKYKHLFEHNPLPMFIWEFDSLQIIDCNKEALVKYGYTKDEFLQLTIRDIRPAEDIPLIEDATKMEEPYGENPVKIWRHRKKNGELMFMKPKGHLVDYHGIKAMLVMLDDITDKLKAEELREFERRDKEALINNTDDIIWSVGTDFKLIAANSAFIKGLEDMAGITLKPGDDLLRPGEFPEDYFVFWEACYKRGLAGETFKKEIYTPVIKDWKESWSEISFNPIYTEDTIVGIACYSKNITERKNAEREQEFEKGNKEALINNTDDLMWSINLDFKLTSANKAYINYLEKFTGVTIKAGDKVMMPDFFPQNIVDYWREIYYRALGGESFKQEFYTPALNDSAEQWSEGSFNPIYKEGSVVGCACYSRDITEKKLAGEKIRQSESHLNEAQRLARMGSWDYDISSDKLTWSKQLYNVFDSDNETFHETYASFLNLIDEKDREFALYTSRQTQETGEPFNIEYHITTRKGKKRVIQEHGYGVKDENGKVFRLFGTSQDITERKKTEEQIKESELRYRTLIEQASDAICIADATSRFIEMNPSGCQLLGYSREEILKLYIVDLLFEEDLVLNPLKIEELRSGKTIRNERRLKRKNGTEVDVGLSGKMLEDGRIIIFISDITERKVVERKLAATTNALQQTLNDLNKIMDSSLDVICAVDAKGNFIRVSAASEAVWGYKQEELLGKPLINFVHPDDHEKTQKAAYNIMAGNDQNHFENRYIRKDGSLVPIEWTARWDANDQVRYGVARDATEKKRMEKIFEDERWRLNDLFLHAPTSIGVLKGPDHVFEIANPLYLELIGKNDIIGKSVKQVLPELVDQGIIEMLDQVYKTGEIVSAKEMLVKLSRPGYSNPVDKYLNFTCQVYRNIDSKIEGIFFFIIDVTEQVLSRRKIEESEKRYRQIVETAQEGIWLIDENDKTTFVNDKMCEIFGYTKEEMIGKDIYYFMDEDGKNYSLKSMEKKREGYEGKEYVKYLSKTGKEIWTNISANPLFNESGEYKGTLAMITDITESRKAEVRNSFKAELLNTIGQAVMATDLDGKINFWNKAAEKIYGWTSEEAIGKNILRIAPDQQTKEQAIELMQELTKGNIWSGEFLVQNKNGQTFPIYITNAPTYDQNKKLSGIIGVSSDITERKLSEVRLKELNENLLKHTKELAISNAELEQFAYVASHDLQEPLRMVTSFLTQLEKKYGKVIDDRGKKYIDFAVDGAKRMRQIILDLLEYSRVGRIEDKLENVDLNEVVAEIQGLYRKKISEKNAVLWVGKLPVINSYNAPLRQVFQNLISNSLKYANKDQPCRIEITVSESNEYWQFTIADNGIGIAREYFDKIFIIFQRLHNKDDFSGTGMGLAVTKKIIENLGGRIWVESEEGKGTAFHFTIRK